MDYLAISRRPRKLTDLVGRVFGRLSVIRFEGYKNGKDRSRMWLCRCECGKEKVLSSNVLTTGNTRSCGCLGLESKRLRVGDKSGLYKGNGVSARNILLNSYRKCAKDRGFSWNLGDGEACELFQGDCHYCGCGLSQCMRTASRHDSGYAYNGIDRVDSSIGYEPGNVVSCCWKCNTNKSDMPYQAFIAWIERVYKRMLSRNDLPGDDKSLEEWMKKHKADRRGPRSNRPVGE